MFSMVTCKRLAGLSALVLALSLVRSAAAQHFPPPAISFVGHDTKWVRVEWNDNSNDESSFRVEYRRSGSSTWLLGETTPANKHIALFAKPSQTANYEFRVSAIRLRPILEYARSAIYTRQIRGETIAPPTDFVIDQYEHWDEQALVRWVDNSNNETGFIVQWRRLGECNWSDLQSVPANTTEAYVFAYETSPGGYTYGAGEVELRVVAVASFTYYELAERVGSDSVCATFYTIEG